MFIDSKNLRIFIYQEVIDMRCGFEKLLHFARDKMKNNVNQGHLYLFFGKNRRRLKALFFDGTGLVLITKKIESGRFMHRAECRDITEITVQEFKQIFNGGMVVRPKVDRSSITQVGHGLLPNNNHKEFKYGEQSQTSLA